MAETLKERVTSGKKAVREIIGRVSRQINTLWRATTSLDKTKPDYNYWDNFRRGLVPGARFVGPLLKAAAEIKADWIMGDGFSAELDTNETGAAVDYTNQLFMRFTNRIKSMMLTLVSDLKGLGDQYAIVNPDGSISVPSPETVDYQYDLLDYRKPLRAVVRTNAEKFEVEDDYRLDGRTITIKSSDTTILTGFIQEGYTLNTDGKSVSKQFENLIGRLPVVHFANARSANETHGRPEHEPLLHLAERYDDSVERGVDAAGMMSNPIPVFEGLEDIQGTVDANSDSPARTYLDSEINTTRERPQLDFDRNSVILLGKGGKFQFASPVAGFTQDLRRLLNLMWFICLEVLHIPEVVWGIELGQARASADEQMKTFYKHIGGQRLALEGMPSDDLLGVEAAGGLHELIDIWLRFRALVDRQVVVAPIRLTWPALGEVNDQLNLSWAESLHKAGVITDETFAQMSDRIEDPGAEVAAAKQQAQDNQDAFNAAVESAMNNAANQPDPQPAAA